jgi:formylglycine-generating enzyme required for sulfatase activity
MVKHTWMILVVAFMLIDCSGNGGGDDAGMDAADAGDGEDANDGGDVFDGDNSGDGDGNGDQGPVYECPFPFAPPQQHTVTDPMGQEIEAWDLQVLCTVSHQDTSAQVLLFAEPTGAQFMGILYEAREAWVCENRQIQKLAPGTFAYEAKHHGWDVMDVTFGGSRYHWNWSEICIGWRPCTSTFDIFDVYETSTGNLVAAGRPSECVRLTDRGNPRPLVPQVRVPADGDELTFQMGSSDGVQDELPVHAVTLKPVRMDVREATWADFVLFLNDHGNDCDGQPCINLSNDGVHLEMQGSLVRPEPGFENHPVVGISWQAAQSYCEWRSWLQLPTEAQWETAASAAGTRDYPWGDNLPSCDLVLYDACGAAAPDPVCSRTAGNSRESVCDLSGNVAEWVSDWYQADFYSTCTINCNDPTGPDTGTQKVIRGGSFQDEANYIRSAARGSHDPSTPSSQTGVRCVRRTFPRNQ